MWGGHGSGLVCSLCDVPILETETEMELEYEGSVENSVVRFHLQCQSIWESARRVPSASSWRSVEREPPPLHAVVEARLSMGESRVIILNVIRICDGETGPVVWLNATTNSPIPDTWSPLEWRSPTVAENATPAAAATQPARGGAAAPRRA
jgi:hypothetical protein